MPVIDLFTERVRRWLKGQLIEARIRGLSAADAVSAIGVAIEDCGFDMGFVPLEPLELAPRLQGLRTVIGYYNPMYTETAIEVT